MSAIVEIPVKHRGDSLTVQATFKNESGTLFDPDAHSIQVYDPSGTAKLVSPVTNPTQQSTGIYRYTYQIPSDAMYGDWRVEWKATEGEYTDTQPFFFNVAAAL